uniref:Uncharacterized protein n=1 Tax=Trichuris muris TaxID=70415 RepID=A0A5S6QKW0_TRIMR
MEERKINNISKKELENGQDDKKSIVADDSTNKEVYTYEGHFKWSEGEKSFIYVNSPPYGNNEYNAIRPTELAHHSHSPLGAHLALYNHYRRSEFLANLRATNFEQSVMQKRFALMMHVQAMNETAKTVDDIGRLLHVSGSAGSSISYETAQCFSISADDDKSSDSSSGD